MPHVNEGAPRAPRTQHRIGRRLLLLGSLSAVALAAPLAPQVTLADARPIVRHRLAQPDPGARHHPGVPQPDGQGRDRRLPAVRRHRHGLRGVPHLAAPRGARGGRHGGQAVRLVLRPGGPPSERLQDLERRLLRRPRRHHGPDVSARGGRPPTQPAGRHRRHLGSDAAQARPVLPHRLPDRYRRPMCPGCRRLAHLHPLGAGLRDSRGTGPGASIQEAYYKSGVEFVWSDPRPAGGGTHDRTDPTGQHAAG